MIVNIFVAAIDDLFRDPELARDALWRVGGADPALPVRVILRQRDRIGSFGETRIVASTTTIELRVSDAPSIAEDDTLEIDGVVYLVQGEPLRDSERLVWTIEAREA